MLGSLSVLLILGLSETDAQTHDAVGRQTKEDSLALKAKSPSRAMLRSILLSGWGQFYNEKRIKGSLIVAAELLCLGGAVYEGAYGGEGPSRTERRNTLFVLSLGVLSYSAIDAYVDAHLYEMERELKANVMVQDQRFLLAFRIGF